jgi:hypothetical protein
MNVFWRKWLSIWSLSVFIFGLVLAGVGFPATDGIAAALFNFIGPEPYAPTQPLRFGIGLMGAVTMGWGGMFFVAFKALHGLDAAQAAPLWRLTVVVGLVWLAIDSSISISTGFWMNAISNLVFTLLLLIPIVRTGVMRG